MTDLEKLIAKTQNAVCVEETTTKHTYFNCFGDKIDEKTTVVSEVYIFDEKKAEWVKGIEENKE